ncbi:hypothetical protein HYW67_00610 [Candidatus Parcubacteria bacterium]|nr:hypothetical protein [Candidatus Parcubacteria bacterium]
MVVDTPVVAAVVSRGRSRLGQGWVTHIVNYSARVLPRPDVSLAPAWLAHSRSASLSSLRSEPCPLGLRDAGLGSSPRHWTSSPCVATPRDAAAAAPASSPRGERGGVWPVPLHLLIEFAKVGVRE